MITRSRSCASSAFPVPATIELAFAGHRVRAVLGHPGGDGGRGAAGNSFFDHGVMGASPHGYSMPHLLVGTALLILHVLGAAGLGRPLSVAAIDGQVLHRAGHRVPDGRRPGCRGRRARSGRHCRISSCRTIFLGNPCAGGSSRGWTRSAMPRGAGRGLHPPAPRQGPVRAVRSSALHAFRNALIRW